MPRTTRQTRPKGPAQGRISTAFTASKITKPHAAATGTGKSADEKAKKLALEDTAVAEIHEPALDFAKASTEEVDDVKEIDTTPTTELAIRHQLAQAQSKPQQAGLDDDDQAALKVSEAQIKRYWREKEGARKAPRVHQQGLSVHEKVLREFDLSYQYGPCIGNARTKRWKRAHKLGLKPPLEVLAVLMKDGTSTNPKIQRAYPDQLMTSHFVIN